MNRLLKHYIFFLLPVLFFSLPIDSYGQSIYEINWEYSGDIEVEAFGWSMCNAGDVNGDGYDDLLVSAIDHSEPYPEEEEEGKLYLFYGSADGLSTTPNWTYQPNDDFTICGFDVSGGDLNGDGYNDIIAGNLQWAGDQIDEGKVTLWYGGPDGPGVEPDWTFEGDQDFALMGSSVAIDGDINSDGYNDLFISAKMYDNGEMDEGKVWMFWGSAAGPLGPVWTYEPNQEGAIAGFPVNYAGDVNGDGYEDVIIGVNAYQYTWTRQGMAVAFYGNPDGLATTPDWVTYGENKKDYYGHWVDGAGDVNGDGYDDVIVSAILYESDSVDVNEGAVYCYYGSPSGLLGTYDWKQQGESIETNFGYCISGGGDINGDGYDEIVVGSKYYTDGEYKEGSAYVFWGSPSGLENDFCWFAEGGQDSAYLGRHVDGDADFNGDGYSDFLASAYRYSNILPNDGIAYCVYGAPRESDFHYPTGAYCKNEDDPVAIIDGWEGGTFSATPGLVFSDIDAGIIDVSSSTVGIHSVTYTYDGAFCNMTSIRYISIGPALYATFSYPSAIISASAPDPTPTIYAGATAGEFSAVPDGLVFVSTETGQIDLDLTTLGVYTVTNTVSNEYCSASFSFEIEIIPPCTEPEKPSVSGITPNAATITWPDMPFIEEYLIYLISAGDTIIFSNYPDTVLYLTDLLPATSYRIWVAAYCGSELSQKSDNLDFNTLYNSVTSILPEGLSVFPIPASEFVVIQYPDTWTAISIQLLDGLGKPLQKIQALPGGNSCNLSMQNLPDGTYYLLIKSDAGVWNIPVPLLH